jgi:hypothetical protein
VGPGQVQTKSWTCLGRIRQFENKMLKAEKWFMVFKTEIINHFLKNKEEFSVKKKKKNYADHYLCHSKYVECKNYFLKTILYRSKRSLKKKIVSKYRFI